MKAPADKRRASAALLLCCVLGLSGCARWRAGPAVSEPRGPVLSSFDDLLPNGITAFAYLPNLPRSKERFKDTELARRLRAQQLRGLWHGAQFLRPWVGAAFEAITDQVDEFAWGRYRGGAGEQWFLIARVNTTARRVISRLNRRVLPRVSEEFSSLQLVRSRFGGRRVYEWIVAERSGARPIAVYAFVGDLLVMGSYRALVRNAIVRRPVWWRFRQRLPAEFPSISPAELQALRAGFRPEDDVYAWFRVEAGRSAPGEAPRSRLERFAARLRRIVALRIEKVGVGLRFTPPQVTGRWRLEFTRPPREMVAARKTPFDFAALVPDSARTFIAIHRLPAGHPLFEELRAILSEALAPGPSGRLVDLVRVLRLLPGVGDLAGILDSLEGRLAYCALPAGENGATDRCLLISLEKPLALGLTLRFLPSISRRFIERDYYGGAAYLHLKVPLPWSADGILLAVVGGALAVTAHVAVLHQVVDAGQESRTLVGLPMIKRFRPFPAKAVLAEFYTAPRRREDTATPAATNPGGDRARGTLRRLLRDRRLDELAAGRAYSLCLQYPGGIEIITSSATGFHWTLPTVGLAAVVLNALPATDLVSTNISGFFSNRAGRANTVDESAGFDE